MKLRRRRMKSRHTRRPLPNLLRPVCCACFPPALAHCSRVPAARSTVPLLPFAISRQGFNSATLTSKISITSLSLARSLFSPAMRIRKGKRCLPLAPADHHAKEYALLRLVAMAAPGGDRSSRRVEYLEHASGASPERLEKYLDCDLERNRVSADDNFNERSLCHEADMDSALRNMTATSPMTKSVFTRHKPPVTTGTICSSTSPIHIKDQSELLEQSLRHVCSRTGDVSVISRVETVSSTDMIEAAKQLRSMQKSHSNSLGSGVVEVCDTPSSCGENHKAVQNMTEDLVGQSKVGTDNTDVTAMNQISSSSASRSQNVTQTDFQCKRDDGKGWRCSRPAEGGYTMCQYHREQICRSQSRRKRPKCDVEPTVAAKSSPSRYVVNTRAVPNAIAAGNDYCPFLDDELAYDERREFVKAKSLKSLLLNKDVRLPVRAKIF